MNRHSLQGRTRRAIAPIVSAWPLVLFAAAHSGAGCSESGDWRVDGTGDSDGSRDAGARDGDGAEAAIVDDAPAAREAASDGARADMASQGRDVHPADAGEDRSHDPIEAGNDGAAVDLASDAVVDASRDASPDPTAPRFTRTNRYSILIPRLGDAGTGTSDASTPDGGASDAGAGDPADVYYPDPPDLRTFGYSFPVVLLLQGAKVARGFYSAVAARVAAYGFVVVVPDHTSNNIGGPGLYPELSEIAAAGTQLKIEAMSATAPVRGAVDTTRIALMGHSYGGASGLSGMANLCFPPLPLCTFQRPVQVVAGAFYGTNLAAPVVGVPALDTGGLPVLLVQGDRDGKALPADAVKTYDQIQKRPKAILTVLGANHFGITDVDNPAGADPEVNAPALDHATGVASIARWTGLFLAAFLEGDTAAKGVLRNAGAYDRHVAITLDE